MFPVHSRIWNINNPKHVAERNNNSTSTEDFMILWGGLSVCLLLDTLSFPSCMRHWHILFHLLSEWPFMSHTKHFWLPNLCNLQYKKKWYSVIWYWKLWQNRPQRLSGNGASRGVAEKVKLNLCVSAGACNREESRWFGSALLSAATVSFLTVGSLPDGCFLLCQWSPKSSS